MYFNIYTFWEKVCKNVGWGVCKNVGWGVCKNVGWGSMQKRWVGGSMQKRWMCGKRWQNVATAVFVKLFSKKFNIYRI